MAYRDDPAVTDSASKAVSSLQSTGHTQFDLKFLRLPTSARGEQVLYWTVHIYCVVTIGNVVLMDGES